MTLADYIYRKTPTYYPTMYLDGFTPEEILMATRKSMADRLTADDSIPEFKIISEVKIR